MAYSSLHNHSFFSLLDGYGSPEEMLRQAQKIGLKAFAITEHSNEYSWCYYDKLKSRYPDIKILYGSELYEVSDTSVRDKSDKKFHLIVIAKNEQGRKDLNKVITKSNLENFYGKPRVQLSDLAPYGGNFVVCSACLASKLAREEDFDKCVQYVNEYRKTFPCFFLEMQSHDTAEQMAYNRKILELSKTTKTPFVITTDSHAATKEDLYYQGRHVQIAHDTETMSEAYTDCYMQTEEEIHAIMDKQIGAENVRLALANTNLIADMIDEVSMPFRSPQFPTYPLPAGFKDNYSFLRYLIDEGWKKRGFDKFPPERQEQYRNRIEYELGVIHQMEFDGYFLVVWDFINYAKTHGVKVGAGRGSGAGSLVCYSIGITDLDPLKYGLIFERFLNPERISMPDLDIDLSDRKTVIDYLVSKYGENRVCQIINFSYITPVVAIKDVGKILGFKYAEMDILSKKFTFDNFADCVNANIDYLSEHPEYSELIDIASHLSGRVKTVSCHAGGVGIVDTDISDYMAMKLGSKGEHVIQVDKRVVEEIGIIKFDLLGVQTLSLVQEIQNDLGLLDSDIDINNELFENDPEPYELLGKAVTNGVFQVESAGMKDLLLRLKANSMEDLSAVLALYRPDSMGALEEYIECKHDPSKVKYIHPDMEEILSETYGCLIYQEQLLNIVRKFGGRSYGGADLFRKAIGKKNVELVKQESAKLRGEIIANGYSEELADTISGELSTKGGYLFNKSHSFSYAVLCFQTAYLKTKYPVYFFKALFNLNADRTGMINKYILDARQFNVEVQPPNINKSGINFTVNDGKILFGLSAIAGIGKKVANEIIAERNLNGKFKGFSDFLERTNLTKAQITALIKSGAIPTKDKRQFLINYYKSLYEPLKFTSVQKLPSYLKLINDFGMDIEKYRIGDKKYDYDKEKMLTDYNDLKWKIFEEQSSAKYQRFIEEHEKYLADEDFWEFQTLQIFIKANPFETAFQYISTEFGDVEIGNYCTIAGVIANVQKKKDRNKKQFAFVNIYSIFGLVEGILWSDKLKRYEELIKKGSQIVVKCKKEDEEKILIEEIRPYKEWISEKQRKQRKEKNGV